MIKKHAELRAFSIRFILPLFFLLFKVRFAILFSGDIMIFDTIENVKNYKGLGRVYTALEFLSKTDFSKVPLGRYDLDGDNLYYMVQEYETDGEKEIAEAHKKYIDIQFMLDGAETVGVAPIDCPKTEVEAKPENDVWFYQCKTEPLTLRSGSFMVLYPNDIHMPGVAIGTPAACRKIVVKVKV